MKEAIFELAAAIRGYTAEMKRYHDDIERRSQDRKAKPEDAEPRRLLPPRSRRISTF